MKKSAEKWCVYHLTHPYFFAHHHVHRRKLDCLREAGYAAWGLAIVPESLYRDHAQRYEEVIASGYMKIIRVARERKVNLALLWFMLRELLIGRRLLMHVLRCDPEPLICLRRIPGVAKRVRYVLEYEGDQPSELVYQQAYVEGQRPPAEPPIELRAVHDRLLATQMREAAKADGLVLMSREHIDLWEDRLARPIRACCLPALTDSRRIRFDATQRDVTRRELGVEDRLVFVYTGNLVCKWQRLEAMCRLLAELRQLIPSTWFLALVRIDDLVMAEEAIRKHGLSDCTTLINVPADAVGRYLSAADVGLFLRHDHPMNTVVTSAKLGEYLAAGLPVVTTGANAAIVNDYIRRTGVGVFIADDLHVDARLVKDLNDLVKYFGTATNRATASHAAEKQLSGETDPFLEYVRFISGITAT